MACKYYYKGKELSYEEFAELLQNGLLQETLKRIEAGKPPVEPPKGKTTEGDGDDIVVKMRSVHQNLVDRSTELTQAQKDAIRTSPEAMYATLPIEVSRKIALDTIQELGVDNAVLEASKNNSEFSPVEKMMVLGAAMDYYAGESKKSKTLGQEVKLADSEIDAYEKLKELADKIGVLGTDYGRAINAIKDIYKLSNIALSRKLEKNVADLNEYRSKTAKEEAKEIVKIVKDDKEAIEKAAEAMTESELESEAGSKRIIESLTKEIEDLRKELAKRAGAEAGSKKNPLKIKRITSDSGYNEAIKRLMGKSRSGLSPKDFSDLVYVGTYHIENGITKFTDWYRVMSKKFGKFKDSLTQVYRESAEDAIKRGADKSMFDDVNTVSKVIREQEKIALEEAKNVIKDRIERVRTQILEKDQKQKQSQKPLQKDLEYERLVEELADLEELRDKYIPELPEKYDVEKTRERLKERLTKDIVSLNEQINTGIVKKKEAKPDFKGDAEIDLLKDIKKRKEEILKKISRPSAEEVESAKAARDLANLTKRKAVAEFNNVMENNPERAKVIAPLIAAKRIATDAKRTLDTPETQVEKTYLQKLVDTVRNKAKEYYKEENTKVPNNDFLAFAIANGKSDVKIWERTKEAVEREIDLDNNLSVEQKEAVKEFLQDYTDSVFETLLTKKQTKGLVREALINAGFKTEKNINGKTVTAVDWKKVTQSQKSKQDAEKAIEKLIEDAGFTKEQAKNELNAILKEFNNKFIEEKTKQTNKFLGKGKINALKQAVGARRATKTEVEKLVDLSERGILDAEKAKEALAEQLGLKTIKEEDFAELRRLLDMANDEKVPPFKKREIEEKIQYIFEKNGGNALYKEHREFISSNMLTSPTNQIQNIVGGYPVMATSAFKTALTTGDISTTAKVFGRSVKEGWETAKTILSGAVGRGSAFSDISLEKQGSPKTRFLEYGDKRFLKTPDVYVSVKVGDKNLMVNLNVFNGLYKQMKFVFRSLEAADAIPSAVISGLKQYSLITRDLKLRHPEWDSKTIAKEAMDWMYNVDYEKIKKDAVDGLIAAGVENPTKAEINRAVSEITERERNRKASEQFVKDLDSVKGMAETNLKAEGNDKPSKEELLAEQYRILGREVPRDYLGYGERQAQIETGKINTIGITSLLSLPIESFSKSIKRGLDSKSSVSRYASNVGDVAYTQLFPFISSIGRWIELQLELTPYGLLKGVGYKAGAEYAKRVKTDTVMTPEEISDMGNHFMMRSILGAGYTLTWMYGLSVLNDRDNDKWYELNSVKGMKEDGNFGKQKVQSAIQPSQTMNIKGVNVPLFLLGNTAMPLMLWRDIVLEAKSNKNKDRSVFMISVATYMTTASEYWYKNFEKNSNLLKDIFSGNQDRAEQKSGNIVGKAVGSGFIPFNRLQQEVAQLADPSSKESGTFMTNALSQLSIMGALSDKKKAFDYRGREYDYGDIFANSADGIVKMFKKGRHGDNIDVFLGKINFGATDAFRTTRSEDNLTYQIKMPDGTTRPMDLDEYYNFRKEYTTNFNKKLSEAVALGLIQDKPHGENEELNNQYKKDLVSEFWNNAKKEAFKNVQSKTGYVPSDIMTDEEIEYKINKAIFKSKY